MDGSYKLLKGGRKLFKRFNKRNLIIILVSSLIIGALLFGIVGCQKSGNEENAVKETNEKVEEKDTLKGDLIVFHAGSLKVPFEVLKAEFEKEHPSVNVLLEGAGSRDCAKKICELNKNCDVMASADYTVIDELLKPDYADWNVKFASNRMVIAYTDKSKYAGEITKDNWYEIFQRDGVMYGHSDPDSDPCGYRSRLVFQLAEEHYGVDGLDQTLIDHCPKENIRPKSVELISLHQSGDLYYAFEYLSVAKQHGLKILELPEEINLEKEELADFYSQASITLADGATKKGKFIVYGVTIPKNSENPEVAMAFVKMLLSENGQKIMDDAGQPPYNPPLTKDGDTLPSELKGIVKVES